MSWSEMRELGLSGKEIRHREADDPLQARWAELWPLQGWPNRFSEQGSDFGALSAHPLRRTLWTLTRKRVGKADAGSLVCLFLRMVIRY